MRSRLLFIPLALAFAADLSVATDCPPSSRPPEKLAVSWRGPAGQPVSAMRVALRYDAAKLALPGSGAAPIARLSATAENAVLVLDDEDGEVRILVSRAGDLPPGRLFTLAFDRCATAKEIGDVTCQVKECGSSYGPVSGCTCEVGR